MNKKKYMVTLATMFYAVNAVAPSNDHSVAWMKDIIQKRKELSPKELLPHVMNNRPEDVFISWEGKYRIWSNVGNKAKCQHLMIFPNDPSIWNIPCDYNVSLVKEMLKPGLKTLTVLGRVKDKTSLNSIFIRDNLTVDTLLIQHTKATVAIDGSLRIQKIELKNADIHFNTTGASQSDVENLDADKDSTVRINGNAKWNGPLSISKEECNDSFAGIYNAAPSNEPSADWMKDIIQKHKECSPADLKPHVMNNMPEDVLIWWENKNFTWGSAGNMAKCQHWMIFANNPSDHREIPDNLMSPAFVSPVRLTKEMLNKSGIKTLTVLGQNKNTTGMRQISMPESPSLAPGAHPVGPVNLEVDNLLIQGLRCLFTIHGGLRINKIELKNSDVLFSTTVENPDGTSQSNVGNLDVDKDSRVKINAGNIQHGPFSMSKEDCQVPFTGTPGNMGIVQWVDAFGQ